MKSFYKQFEWRWLQGVFVLDWYEWGLGVSVRPVKVKHPNDPLGLCRHFRVEFGPTMLALRIFI